MIVKKAIIVKCCVVFAAVCLLLGTAPADPQARAGIPQSQEASAYFFTDAHLHLEAGLWTLDLKNASVGEVLCDLSRRADFELIIHGGLQKQISAKFSDISLEDGLKRIMRLAKLDSAIMYEAERTSSGLVEYKVKRLVVITDTEGMKRARSHPIHERTPEVTRRKVKAEIPEEETFESEPKTGSTKFDITLSGNRKSRESDPVKATFEGSEEDFDKYLSDLAESKQISSEQYELIRKDIGKKKFGKE